MAQITDGVRAVLSHPRIYRTFQSLMGPSSFRPNFVNEFVRPFPGMKVLDIGCGPADILAFLPNVEYRGYDISESYIQHAKKRFGTLGKFHCKHLEEKDLAALPQFDIVLALGLLHHLDDAAAASLIQLAGKALGPGGRLVTIDPVLDPAQNPIARFMVRNDRGQNVRDKAGYLGITNNGFQATRVEVRHQTWVPYTHCIMECSK